MQRLNELPLTCKLQHLHAAPVSTRHERHPVVCHTRLEPGLTDQAGTPGEQVCHSRALPWTVFRPPAPPRRARAAPSLAQHAH